MKDEQPVSWTCECCDGSPEFYVKYVLTHGSFPDGKKNFTKLACAEHLSEVIASAASLQGTPAVVVENIKAREEWKRNTFAQHYGQTEGQTTTAIVHEMTTADVLELENPPGPFVIVRSKWGRMHHLWKGLKLQWCNERGPHGRSTGKKSKHRFQFGDFLLAFNKNRDNTSYYVREITEEQSLELRRLEAKAEIINTDLHAVYKAHSDFIKTCFETGRPIPVAELVEQLSVSGKAAEEVVDGTIKHS